MAGLDFLTDYTSKKRDKLNEDNTSIDKLSENSNQQTVMGQAKSAASESAVDRFKNSPLIQLGGDFISEQVAKNGQQIINNAFGILEGPLAPVRKTIEQAQQLAFHAIAAAITAKNDLMLHFLQETAREAIKMIDKKAVIAKELQYRVRLLYNALVILVAGQPFFSKYLARLRQAILLLFSAETKLKQVRNGFVATNIFVNTQFDQAQADLVAAEKFLAPEDENPANKFTHPTLLSGVGVPSESQQLNLVISIPQLARDVMNAANGYFAATFKLNALLLAFITGLGALEASGSKKLREYTISMLDELTGRVTSLINRMSNDVNGDPLAVQQPLPNFAPNSVGVSASALGWLLELRAIIEFAKFVPGKTLGALQLSNAGVKSYQDAVEKIKTKDNRTSGDAVLIATDGREEVGQLESQISVFTLNALQAIVDGKAASNVLALGRSVIARLDLTLTQDAEIRAILQEFADHKLPLFEELAKTGSAIQGMLGSFGLDRAADMLKGGAFEEFFNLNSKTATYAGAALVGIAVLKECLTTTEDREQLDQAEREIQRENKSKELLAQRGAVTGLEQQKVSNKDEDRRLVTVEERAQQANSKCGLPDDFSPPNLIKNIGSVIGVPLLGGGGSTSFLNKIGKGII